MLLVLAFKQIVKTSCSHIWRQRASETKHISFKQCIWAV